MQTTNKLRLRGILAALPLVLVASAPASFGAAASDEDVIELSPFEVQTSPNDIGYYAENTLAGSRLNTNVSNLASSITVVTKQQMIDTAAIDINDVFLYEANTEGAGNFTDYNIDTRGAVQDRNAGFQGGAPSLPYTPYTSNRIRGIPGTSDKMRDYYSGNARLPWDSYNTESVEINRGPNSIIFGLGSPAGLVNQSTAKARLNSTSNHVEARVGDEGAFRGVLSFNRPLVEDKLAVHFAMLYDEKGFSRKPSHDITRRQFAALTFKPFEKTTIRANFENFENDNRRPNSVTPRDFVSPWIAAGRPSYNPVTQMLTLNGVTTGPYNGSNAASIDQLRRAGANTIAFSGSDRNGSQRPVLLLDQGEEIGFVMQQVSTTPTTAGVPAAFTYNSPLRTTKSQGPKRYVNVIPGTPAGIGYSDPGVQDGSIYDWEKINIISTNFGNDEASIFNVEFEQEILPDLHVQLGWYKEDFDSSIQYYISQQTGVTLFVDTNTVNLDGTPNPNFGRPFVEVIQPDGFQHPEDNSTKRATAAYEFDFTDNDGWVSWLGRHRVMGLWSDQRIDRSQLRSRPLVTTNTMFNPVVANVWAGNTFQNAIERRMYVGDNSGAVTQDPGWYPNGTRDHSLRWFNPATSAWENTTVTIDTDLHFVSDRSRQDIESRAIALQSYFWDERIVTTVGRRRDTSEASRTAFLGIRSDGRSDRTGLDQFGDPQIVTGNTTTYGGVIKPLDWLSFHYNKSDNFQPAGLSTDFFGNPLPLPTGEGKDWGVGFTLLENKLYATLNWFEASQENSRGAVVQQPLTRTQTVDDTYLRTWAQWVTGSATNNSAAVNAILQLPANLASAPPNTFFGTLAGATSTVAAEGLEAQIVYNPMPNWTMKFTAGEQETIYSSIAPQWDAWVAQRLPVWQNATAAGFPDFWDEATGTDLTNAGFTTFTGASQTVSDYWFENVVAVMNTAKKNEGKVTQDQRKWRWNFITNYRFIEGPLQNFGVGGAVRWEDKAAIGYRAAAPDPDGVIRSLDVNQPIYDESQTHLDLWFSYVFDQFPYFGDKVRTKLQLNVRDALEGGGLQPIAANPDGQYTAFRIVDPRQWFLSATFDF